MSIRSRRLADVIARAVCILVIAVTTILIGAAGIRIALAHYGVIGDVPPAAAAAAPALTFRGAGLTPGQKITVDLLGDFPKVETLSALSDKSGGFGLRSAALEKAKASRFLVHVSLEPPPGAPAKPQELFFEYSRTSSMVATYGRGFPASAAVTALFDGAPADQGTATDWAGAFSTTPLVRPQIAAGNGELCLKIAGNTAPGGHDVTVCVAMSASARGEFAEAAFVPPPPPPIVPPPAIPTLSPFSTWAPPDQCAPAYVLLSVCNPVHMQLVFLLEIDNWVRSLMMMTTQLSTTMIQQMQVIGSFMDAKQELEIQRTFQLKQAEASKDYHPSDQMCRVATFSKGLNTSEQLTRLTSRVIDKYLRDRQTGPAVNGAGGSVGTGAPQGPALDKFTRVEQFIDTYCNVNDNGLGGLGIMCAASGPAERQNREVDFTRLVEKSLTLDTNFLDNNPTADETDILTLGKYLYAHDIFTPISERALNNAATGDDLDGVNLLQDVRSVIAMRGIATNSFANIIAMKTHGAGYAEPHMLTFLREFGLADGEITAMMKDNPSYFAEMEILTSKMYQHPNFYTNLYDKPANVERIGTSLEAIKIMNDRDRFDASLRREMLVSILLEAKIRQIQKDLDNDVDSRGTQ